MNGRLASGDSGCQLNLEIALSGVSAKVQSAFQPGRRCVETSDDVIKDLVQNCGHRVKPFSFLIWRLEIGLRLNFESIDPCNPGHFQSVAFDHPMSTLLSTLY